MAAKFIGWDNSPFQAEVVFASLGVGIAGVLAYNASSRFALQRLFRPLHLIGCCVGGHIYQMVTAHNFLPGNVALVLSERHPHFDHRLAIFVAVLQASGIEPKQREIAGVTPVLSQPGTSCIPATHTRSVINR